MSAAATVVRAALREHIRIPDAVFDQLYPDHVRRLSAVHWTPIAAALRAAELLAPRCDARVLDIGAGAGKLCCVGAAAYAGSWHGIDPLAPAGAPAHARPTHRTERACVRSSMRGVADRSHRRPASPFSGQPTRRLAPAGGGSVA